MEKSNQLQGKSKALLSFLTCTLSSDSPISKLRGLDHILQEIWELASDDWLDLHIERFPTRIIDKSFTGITRLDGIWPRDSGNWFRQYPTSRRNCAGCPAAIFRSGLTFPFPTGIYVNMMPICLSMVGDSTFLPKSLKGYEDIVKACLRHANYESQDVAYLTIDERITEANQSQRRPGLHVESPGVMPFVEEQENLLTSISLDSDTDVKYFQLPSGRYVPGAEHHWGRGLMMRDEYTEGGIFLASNVSDTTAVWNCHINNEDGRMIGPHGDIERLRYLLGKPSYLLKAGELLWMTDRTPHESLPVQPVRGADGSMVVPHRQYFRLVVGEVSAWFADHSTPSELGVVPPESVRIIYGDKFELYRGVSAAWSYDTKKQIEKAYALRELRLLMCRMGLGYLYEGMKRMGYKSLGSVTCLSYDILCNGWFATTTNN